MPQRQLRFQQEPSGPTWHSCRCPHYPRPESQHGTPWRRRMVRRSLYRALSVPQVLRAQHFWSSRCLDRRLVPAQSSISPSYRRRVPTTNRFRHAHAHPGQVYQSNLLAHLRFQHHQCVHPDRANSQTSHSTPRITSTSTFSTGPASHRRTPSTRTEGARPTSIAPSTSTEGARPSSIAPSTRTEGAHPCLASISESQRQAPSYRSSSSSSPKPSKPSTSKPSVFNTSSPVRHQRALRTSHLRSGHHSTYSRQTRFSQKATPRSRREHLVHRPRQRMGPTPAPRHRPRSPPIRQNKRHRHRLLHQKVPSPT